MTFLALSNFGVATLGASFCALVALLEVADFAASAMELDATGRIKVDATTAAITAFFIRAPLVIYLYIYHFHELFQRENPARGANTGDMSTATMIE